MTSGGAEDLIKTSWRMPKPLLKQLKQYALDNDMNLQQVAMKAFNDLLKSGILLGRSDFDL
jgi:hypothetical protein